MFILAATGFASPLNDYSQGKVAVDIDATNVKLSTSDNTGSSDWDKKTNIGLGITGGLGKNFAVQYKYQKADSDPTTSFNVKAESTIQEFNVLYKLDNNFNAFIGAHRLSGEVGVPGYGSVDVKSTTKYQVGITGIAKLAEKTNGWATIAAGNDNQSYEVGVGYELSKDADLNVFYRYTKFTGLELQGVSNYNFDAKSDGLGFGVTFKF
jgi:predicted porin